MNSDSYSFAKSSSPQGVDLYTPYAEKQWNYINDINSGVYTATNTLVQFDLTSIYNSGQFSDASDLFLTIPIVMQAKWATAAAAGIAPVAGHANLLTMKTNFQHLVHQVEVVANGKTINDTQPFVNVYQHFKLASQMSQNDLKQFGPSLGFAPVGLDNEKSVKWIGYDATSNGGGFPTTSTGYGLTNNRPFGEATLGVEYQNLSGVQNQGAINTALTQRASRLVDATTGTFNGVYGTATTTATAVGSIMNQNQLNAEFKGYYSVAGTDTMTWQDLAVIPLKYLCDCIDKMGLVKKLDLNLRIYLNTGGLTIGCANTAGPTNALRQVVQSSFSNTCPFTINSLGTALASVDGGIPLTATRLGCSLSVGRSSTAQFPASGGASFTMSSVSHFMPACRCYYSLVKLEPSRALAYIEENRQKQVVYENLLFNQYSGIGFGTSFSQLVQSGIKNPIGIAIIPFIAGTQLANSSTAFSAVVGGEQYQSPYDTCPATYSPVSLTNLQVALGGVNQLQSTLYYTFENFLEQVALAEGLTSTDLGIGTGLISQSWWEMNRVYYVDLSRGREADKASMRNLTVSFINNSNVTINVMIFTLYLDKFVIDVETGIVKK